LKIKIDENLPGEFGHILRSAGFEADTVGEEELCGADDETVLHRSQAENRVLMTLDLDFSNIRAYPSGNLQGMIVLRPRTQDKLALISLLRRLMVVLGDQSPKGQLWIVEPDRIRFREG
jgi:predicted nuclease of predicted toxin-antitoxin system